MQHPDESTGNANRRPGRYPVLVWDIPTRIFHWTVVIAVTVSFITGEAGGTAMTVHVKSGIVILGLVLFRLLWGIWGSPHSRFSDFVRGPAAVFRYAKTMIDRVPSPHLGHNPLGGWSVLLLLASLLIQAGTGLFSNDDILTQGPLASMVTKEISDRITGVHHMNAEILFFLAAVHIGAIIFYFLYKKDNLILPMFSGRKKWPNPAPDGTGRPWLAIGTAALAALAVAGLLALGKG